MTSETVTLRPLLLDLDPRKALFSISSFLAVSLTLVTCFMASLPRPWWAMLTVYVTAQPLSGAFRPKIFHRLGGVAVGALIAVAAVPNLQNAPELLVAFLAVWTGICIYFAVLDRTPRAFLFQMAAFSSAVISFPYLDDPADIFVTTAARVQEMTLGIVSVTIVHALLQPWSVVPGLCSRARSFLANTSGWTIDVLTGGDRWLTYERRRLVASDVTELGLIAIHLPRDQAGLVATRRLVHRLQERLSNLIPIASGIASRLELLRKSGATDTQLTALIGDVVTYLQEPIVSIGGMEPHLVDCCRQQSETAISLNSWQMLLTASLCDRMAEFMTTYHEACVLLSKLEQRADGAQDDLRFKGGPREPLALSRDHALAALAGLATTSAIALYCLIWILLAWPSGSATAAFAALITCSFATQDDPAPQLGRYLWSTLLTFPLAAFYLFAVLPRVDGCFELLFMLAPALLWIGYLQADPARSARALPMFACFIVAMGFVDRFQGDFTVFLNTGLAQMMGIVTAILISRLFRSANARWTARRIIRANWRDLSQLANPGQPLAARAWTARAVDRLGQIALRMALADPEDRLHAADGLDDLRIGRNLIQLRHAMAEVDGGAASTQRRVLLEASAFYRRRWKKDLPLPAPRRLLRAIDRALDASKHSNGSSPHRVRLALVGMRCNLFNQAADYSPPTKL